MAKIDEPNVKYISIDELRQFPGLEYLSDSDAESIIKRLYELSLVMFNFYEEIIPNE